MFVQTYFQIMEHNINTRNNGALLRLPKIRTVAAKKGFYFNGAKSFNDLPLKVRNTDSVKEFKVLLNSHFN